MEPSFFIDRIHALQKELEEQLVDKTVVCDVNPNQLNNLDTIYDGKLMLLRDTLRHAFFNASFMKWMACNFNGTFTSSIPSGRSQTRTHAITSNIKELVVIGAPSVDGAVWASTFKKVEGLFLLKTAKTARSNVTLYHEYFVASMCLNALRAEISNFMYIYGAFECTPPEAIEVNKKIKAVKFCMEGPKPSLGTYLVIEQIPGSTTFAKLAPTVSALEVVSWLLQLAAALGVARAKYGFCHYDLHNENVLLRSLGTNGYVKLPNKTGYVVARYIPTIIDYGRSRVMVEGRSYGYYDNFGFGVNPDVTKPECDLYKLLGFTMFDLYSENRKLFDALMPAFRFFPHVRNVISYDMKPFLDEERRNFLTLGDRWNLTETQRDTFYSEFASHLAKNYDLITSKVYVKSLSDIPKGAPLYNCQDDTCSTTLRQVKKSM
jgi:hypothetical protein